MNASSVAERLADVDPALAVLLLSLTPGVEPRYAVVLGATVLGASLAEAVAASLVGLIVLSLLLPSLLEALFRLLAWAGRRSRLARRLHRLLESLAERSARRVSRGSMTVRVAGLAVFVAIPLPMTGIYTGALAAYFLGLPPRETRIALLAGGAASLLITLLAAAGASYG